MKRLYNSGDVVQESTFKFLCGIKRKGTIAFICKYIQHGLCETACNNRQLLSSGDGGGTGIRRLAILERGSGVDKRLQGLEPN